MIVRRKLGRKLLIAGSATAIGMAAITSAGTNRGVESGNLSFELSSQDGAGRLLILMNGGVIHENGGAAEDVVINDQSQSVFANNSAVGLLDGNLNAIKLDNRVESPRMFNDRSFDFGRSSGSSPVNGNALGFIDAPGDGGSGDIQGIPLPMPFMLGLGGLVLVGLIRRFGR